MRDEKPLNAITDELLHNYESIEPEMDTHLTAAVTFLNSLDYRPTIEKVCSAIGVSPSQLRSLSNKTYGVPFSKIIMWREVTLALQFIANGASISEAAHNAGFSDQAHFSRVMRETIGITPGTTKRISD
jgi:AraC-like DNA-binding protein